MALKDLIDSWNNRGDKKILGEKLETKTVVEKHVPRHPYFRETFKVMFHLDQEEERLAKEMSYTQELEMYEKELKKAKNEEEYEQIENHIKRLKRAKDMNFKKISVTIPEEKVQVILDNHQIEHEEAKKDFDKLKKRKADIQAKIQKLKEEEKKVSDEVKVVDRLIDQANVLPYVLKEHGNTIVLQHNKEDGFGQYPIYKTLLNLSNWHISSKHPYKTIKEVK